MDEKIPSLPVLQETIAQRRDKTRCQPILASRHHRPSMPTSSLRPQKGGGVAGRRVTTTVCHPQGHQPATRLSAATPARRHFPTHQPAVIAGRQQREQDGCWCRRLGSSLFIRDCAATKISAATTGWAVGFPWSRPSLAIYAGRGDSKSTTAMASSDRRWDARIPFQLHCQRRCNGTTTSTTTMEAMQDASWLAVEESLRLSSGSLVELSAVGGLRRGSLR